MLVFRAVPAAVLLFGALLLTPFGAGAQQDVLQQARGAPTRADSLRILEAHLARIPGDVDARLLYGQMLSWERRFDEARTQLQQVLAEKPDYLDARRALMNVEWWSGNRQAALEHSEQILREVPGDPEARLVRDRATIAGRVWSAGLALVTDTFSDDREIWQEQLLSVSRLTPAGTAVLRASRADRFGLDDQQIELEFYPVFKPGTYAFVGVGLSTDRVLYPKHRLALDLYHAVGGGVELSIGYRRLGFGVPADVYVGTATKYVGLWTLTGKLYYAETRDAPGTTSGHIQVRRYFGESGLKFVGATYGHGLNREEIRGSGDLGRGAGDSLRLELDLGGLARTRIQLSAASSREERAAAPPLWQHTLSAGFLVRF